MSVGPNSRESKDVVEARAKLTAAMAAANAPASSSSSSVAISSSTTASSMGSTSSGSSPALPTASASAPPATPERKPVKEHKASLKKTPRPMEVTRPSLISSASASSAASSSSSSAATATQDAPDEEKPGEKDGEKLDDDGADEKLPERPPGAPLDMEYCKFPGGECDLCKGARSIFYCEDCNMKLCGSFENNCDEDMHRVTSRRKHKRWLVRQEETKEFSRMIICYLCGQKFTSASLPIHLESCPVSRKVVYRDLPKELRPPIPSAPKTPMPSEKADKKAYAAYNKEASGIFKDHLAKCPHPGCGRAFEATSIMKHVRGCRFRPK